MLCAPAVFVMLAVTLYPLVYAVWLSLQRYDLRVPGAHEFVGLRNYLTVLSSNLWWKDFLATAVITVTSVAIELVIGMALAMFMHRAIFGRRTVRTSILIPYGIITVVAAFAWQFAFTPDLGFVNTWLNTNTAWLTERSTSYLVITMTEVWKTTPFMSLLLLAGLAIVPEELQEAAKVDGATAWQRFTKVTLPTMKAAVLVALLFRTLDAFRIFDTVFIQTKGANDTETLSFLGYNQLINRVNLGVGSAVSVLLFIAVILIAAVFVKGFNTDLGQVRGER
ncbi:MAG: sugar ABC transporter permease [Actinomycetota bacterium]|nr:sugar ABC transporter permease [Actinomycetota bacterium]